MDSNQVYQQADFKGRLNRILWHKIYFYVVGWVTKLLGGGNWAMGNACSLSTNPDIPHKMIGGRHKQWSGQQTLNKLTVKK